MEILSKRYYSQILIVASGILIGFNFSGYSISSNLELASDFKEMKSSWAKKEHDLWESPDERIRRPNLGFATIWADHFKQITSFWVY